MGFKNFQLLIILSVFVSFGLKAQSPCYFIMLGAKPGEQIRVDAPSFHFYTNSQDGLIKVIMVFSSPPTPLAGAREIDVQIKLHESGEFRPVKLKIPNQEGCHLLLVRDLKLRSPLFFRAEWISQGMMDEYLFPPDNNGFDTTLFVKDYKTKISQPDVSITYKGELLTSQLIQTVNPFNGQNIELDLEISKSNEATYTAQLKAVEISFIHPNLIDLESKYITASSFIKWPKDDEYFYCPMILL